MSSSLYFQDILIPSTFLTTGTHCHCHEELPQSFDLWLEMMILNNNFYQWLQTGSPQHSAPAVLVYLTPAFELNTPWFLKIKIAFIMLLF